jgi:hypothetical protein
MGFEITGARRPDRDAELPETDNSTRNCLWLVSSEQFSTQRRKEAESRRKEKLKFLFAPYFHGFAPLRETFFLPYSGRSLFEDERRGNRV